MNYIVSYNAFKDFYINRTIIRAFYEIMTYEDKKKYKLYVYSRPFQTEYEKDLIWEYLQRWEQCDVSLEKEYLNIYS